MLAGQKFASREDKPYCANCFGELFAKRCTACSKPITGAGGTRFISFEGTKNETCRVKVESNNPVNDRAKYLGVLI